MKIFFIKRTFFLLTVLVALNAYGQNNIPPMLLKNINAIYNKYPVIKSKFIQLDSLGRTSNGWFIFDKANNKARIEYTDSPLRIIINNNSIMIEQTDLKEKAFSPLLSSPFKYLLSRDINLNYDKFNINNFIQTESGYEITLSPKDNAFKGEITLIFNTSYYLHGWVIKDELANLTKVTLVSPQYHSTPVPSNIFNTHKVVNVNYNNL